MLEHLTKRFGGLTAVNDVSTTHRAGKINAIIGPNGAGKTTFFNLISGVHRPTSGTHHARRP
jgi:branched-chain amino acid transport system ATP-binding protein